MGVEPGDQDVVPGGDISGLTNLEQEKRCVPECNGCFLFRLKYDAEKIFGISESKVTLSLERILRVIHKNPLTLGTIKILPVHFRTRTLAA